ncbi:hypothetical protein FHG87_022632, partial [Trinorchestia longiramus]
VHFEEKGLSYPSHFSRVSQSKTAKGIGGNCTRTDTCRVCLYRVCLYKVRFYKVRLYKARLYRVYLYSVSLQGEAATVAAEIKVQTPIKRTSSRSNSSEIHKRL